MESTEEKELILNTVREILESNQHAFQNLIVILQDIQDKLRYIPAEAMLDTRHREQSGPRGFSCPRCSRGRRAKTTSVTCAP